MSPTLTTFLFELVNFLLLAALLGWLLFTPVRRMLEARQAADRKRAEELAAKTAEADRLVAEEQARRASFDAEMTRARSERVAAAEQEAADILAKASEATERERQRASQMLAHVEQAQLEELARAAAAAARQGVARLLAAIDAPELDSGLVRAACRQLQALDATTLGAVLVESAKPLGDQDRAALATALGTRAASSAFRVVPALGAGVRVTTSRGLVEASVAGVAAEAERWLTARLVSDHPAETT